PKIILADEPTGALDKTTASDIMDVFGKLNAEGITVALVTHDEETARRCGRILMLSDGKIKRSQS
ncbi:MAG: ABC transporter ATP-binding protein, partial [Oscillospiraceae bacterium]|nr:ABC transporter ATP-binding protein [Oscillospiraceae bacterium]